MHSYHSLRPRTVGGPLQLINLTIVDFSAVRVHIWWKITTKERTRTGPDLRGDSPRSMNGTGYSGMRRTLEGTAIGDFSAGAAIANKFGVPGTLGSFGLARDDDRLVLLTSHHVLFGARAGEHDTVWVAVTGRQRSFQRAAQTRHGRCGTVCFGGIDVHIDCATAELRQQRVPHGFQVTPEPPAETLLPGDRVSKTGAATQTTEGIVVDTNHTETAWVQGRKRVTPVQILIKSAAPADAFSADGDSGAIVRNAAGAAAGLLWGIDRRGFGLACPIEPVLDVLHIRLAKLALQEIN